MPSSTDPCTRLRDHVRRLEQEHPPLDPRTVDHTVRDPAALVARCGPVLDYMARTELEVERNVLELVALLPDPPEVDRHFFAEVWQPQEVQHGVILDELQVRLGRPPARTDLTAVSPKIQVLGALGHLTAVQDVTRMLYYLTGLTTERSALLAYHRLHDGVVELDEAAVAETVVAPIRRQEPGHYAFYQMSAVALWDRLCAWQRWLVRRLRDVSFTPVGAGTREQRADVGEMMIDLGLDTPDEAGRQGGLTRPPTRGRAARGTGPPPRPMTVAVSAARVRGRRRRPGEARR